MALLAASVLPPTLKIKVKQFERQPSSQLHAILQASGHRRISPKLRMKITVAQFGDPNRINKIKEQLNIVKETLWENTPDSVKNFPWEKAENLLLQRLLIVGKKALKLSLVTLFVVSFLSDFIDSVFRNQELMIPLGLIVGCLMTDFLKETSQVAFRSSEEVKDLNWHLAAIGCFFVVVKFVSGFFAVQTRVFLLHVANGGLMQVLWLWRSLLEENGDGESKMFSRQNIGSSTVDAES